METLSFAFGVLTVIAVVLTTVVAVGMVKVLKMQKQISELDRNLGTNVFGFERRVDDEVRGIYSSIEDIHGVIADDQREVNLRIDQLNSYVDSRFDKMENKFNGNNAKKQLND